MLQPKASDHLLDIGCGIGGPARWIAAKYGCHVTGVDLTAEFCEAARELNSLSGLADRVQILHGSALSLPLPDNSFDRAYSQAALMNISDKRGVFREALRVLRPGGSLALFLGRRRLRRRTLLSAALGHHDRTSVSSSRRMKCARDLLAAGFQIVSLRDTSAVGCRGFCSYPEANWKQKNFRRWASTLSRV